MLASQVLQACIDVSEESGASVSEELNELRVVRGGKLIDVAQKDIKHQKKLRKLRKRKGSRKRTGPLSAAVKQKIAKSRKKAAKLQKQTR
tara:strand:- start:975 stop:1244 length:270 start_codon:yes stop_codon:yes gene_type:complete